MKYSDSELISSFQGGKYSAFEQLYKRNFDKVYRYLFFKTGGNRALTQDITSETFLKAFESLANFKVDKESNFTGWLLSIAHHSWVDYIRGNIKSEVSLHEAITPSEEKNLFEHLNLKMETQEILNFLETLGSEKREIILMRIRQNLSYDEIAPLLEKTPEACRKLFSRTMKTLIEQFGK